jgi:hypothetical protein
MKPTNRDDSKNAEIHKANNSQAEESVRLNSFNS